MQANSKKKPAKKAKKSKKDDDDDDDDSSGPSGVVIELNSHVSLTFSLKYLVNFAKSTSISNKVQLMLSSEVPLLVRYFLLSTCPALIGATGLV
jgi:proliferating cell nuclear antigen